MSRSMVHSDVCSIIYSVGRKFFFTKSGVQVAFKTLRKKEKKKNAWIEKENGISKDEDRC